MSDLISREDALRVTLAYSSSYSAEQAETAIRALPAVQPDADELVGHMTKLIAAGLDRIEQLTAERDLLREALEGAESWLERWAVHVGNCAGGRACTCGLTFVQYETGAALKGETT